MKFASLLLLIPISIFSQQGVDSSNRKSHVNMWDTSEQGLVNNFRNMMNNSETVIDAQVISMESKWAMGHYDVFPKGERSIYTAITFEVFHWLKGSGGDEITFYQEGGKIGDTVVTVTHSPIFSLRQRAIFFFQNKGPNSPNTFLICTGRIQIFGAWDGRHGTIFLGRDQVDAENYVDIVKQSVTDTTAYPKYIHSLKMADEENRLRVLKSKNSDTTKEGGK